MRQWTLALVLIALGFGKPVTVAEVQRPEAELVMLFVSDSKGPANAEPGFAETIRDAKTVLASKSRAAGVGFVAVGASIDSDPHVGWDYLVKGIWDGGTLSGFGEWDEIHVGRSWRNGMVVEYVFRTGREGMNQDVPVATIPQVLIFERTVEIRAAGLDFGPDRVVKRIAGIRALRQWLDNGAPTPGSELLQRQER